MKCRCEFQRCGEGLFGVTFNIRGDIANPQVNVNFASIFTPGIFREIMQMTPENPRVQPRDKQPARNEPGAARSSSTSTVKPSGSASGEPGVTPDIGAGWSAEATDASRTRKK